MLSNIKESYRSVLIFDNDYRCSYLHRKETDRTEQSVKHDEKDFAAVICDKLIEYFRAHLSFPPGDLRASLTIEAAIVLPLFIFMMFILVFPIKLMDDERRLQNQVESIGKQLTAVEYIKKGSAQVLKDKGSIGEFIYGSAEGFEKGTAAAVILADAQRIGSIKGAYLGEDTEFFSDSEGKDTDMLHIELGYNVRFPFSAYLIRDIRKSIVVNRRAWTGTEGGRGRGRYGEDPDAAEDDRMVYVGKSSVVYHEDPKCHYLSNVMKSTDASYIQDMRNDSGGRYHACPSCKPNKAGMVYYFASGTAYHSDESCKAVTAYARAVKKSEVSDMRACSYCGGKH